MFDLVLKCLEIYLQLKYVDDKEHDKVLLDMYCSYLLTMIWVHWSYFKPLHSKCWQAIRLKLFDYNLKPKFKPYFAGSAQYCRISKTLKHGLVYCYPLLLRIKLYQQMYYRSTVCFQIRVIKFQFSCKSMTSKPLPNFQTLALSLWLVVHDFHLTSDFTTITGITDHSYF